MNEWIAASPNLTTFSSKQPVVLPVSRHLNIYSGVNVFLTESGLVLRMGRSWFGAWSRESPTGRTGLMSLSFWRKLDKQISINYGRMVCLLQLFFCHKCWAKQTKLILFKAEKTLGYLTLLPVLMIVAQGVAKMQIPLELNFTKSHTVQHFNVYSEINALV